jgi:hypothetical protein
MKKIIFLMTMFVLIGMSVATDAVGDVAIGVLDGTVSYGHITVGASVNTFSLGDMQIVTNNGTVAEKFSIKGRDSANWVLKNIAGTDEYVHGFCIYTVSGDCDNNPGPNDYTALGKDYTTLANHVNISGTVNFHLQLTTPTENSSATEQQVGITILAEEVI